jgi:hypothetical protein
MFDLLVSHAMTKLIEEDVQGGEDGLVKKSQELARRYFKEEYEKSFKKLTKNLGGQIPYTLAASK